MDTMIMAIDPGSQQSAYCVVDHDCRPVRFGKIGNTELLHNLGKVDRLADIDRCVIEWISSYGMPVGEEVFDTAFWVGRFYQTVDWTIPCQLIKRGPVKLHHCGSSRAKDANITQALVDRFTPGQPNHGKGTKKDPGWFHGFFQDIWQAYALAVYALDTAKVPA
jgi:hypothetical protein